LISHRRNLYSSGSKYIVPKPLRPYNCHHWGRGETTSQATSGHSRAMILCRSSSVSAKMMSFIKPCASSKLWNNRCLILLMMQYSINSFSPFGLCLTNRQVAPRAADRSETPSPKKNTIGAGCIVVYGAIAFDLSCPKPLIHHGQSNAKQQCVMLPLGMTVLNVPAPIIV
jgi:hypothetical protein